MKVIIADNNTTVLRKVLPAKEIDCPVLLSYWFFETVQNKMNFQGMMSSNREMYLDSGVFSARKSDYTIPLSNLLRFYHQYSSVWNWVFSLDQGTLKEQYVNFRTQIKASVPTIGIYHAWMPIEMIDRFAEHTNYIAVSGYISGGFNKSPDLVLAYLDRIFEYIHSRNLWPLKVHILGCELSELLTRYPFYSCDASTLSSAYRFGKLQKFDPIQGKIIGCRPKDNLQRALKIGGSSTINYIRSGTSKEEWSERRKTLIYQAAYARHEYQKYLTKYWENKGIIWTD